MSMAFVAIDLKDDQIARVTIDADLRFCTWYSGPATFVVNTGTRNWRAAPSGTLETPREAV